MKNHFQPSGLWHAVITGIRLHAVLAIAGLVLSASGGVVEAWWWMANKPTWQHLYQFFFAGAPFWWSLALHLAGGVATLAHWFMAERGRWWALPGGLLFFAWLVRVVVGLLILLLWWLIRTFESDLLDTGSERRWRRRRGGYRRRR